MLLRLSHVVKSFLFTFVGQLDVFLPKIEGKAHLMRIDFIWLFEYMKLMLI